jgi:hypothetical protein
MTDAPKDAIINPNPSDNQRFLSLADRAIFVLRDSVSGRFRYQHEGGNEPVHAEQHRAIPVIPSIFER